MRRGRRERAVVAARAVAASAADARRRELQPSSCKNVVADGDNLVAKSSVGAEHEEAQRGRRRVVGRREHERRGRRGRERSLSLVVVVKVKLGVLLVVAVSVVVDFGKRLRRTEPADQGDEVGERLAGPRLRREDGVGRGEQGRDRRGLEEEEMKEEVERVLSERKTKKRTAIEKR